MNNSSTLDLFPKGWPHLVLGAAEKKLIAESVIEGVLNQIASEQREPTKWECDSLSNAMGALLF